MVVEEHAPCLRWRLLINRGEPSVSSLGASNRMLDQSAEGLLNIYAAEESAQVKISRRQRLMLCEGITSIFAWGPGSSLWSDASKDMLATVGPERESNATWGAGISRDEVCRQ